MFYFEQEVKRASSFECCPGVGTATVNVSNIRQHNHTSIHGQSCEYVDIDLHSPKHF